MQDPRTMPRDTDEHLVFIEFYTDRINGLAGAKAARRSDDRGLRAMISAHRRRAKDSSRSLSLVSSRSLNRSLRRRCNESDGY
jgi:hypothetical protein